MNDNDLGCIDRITTGLKINCRIKLDRTSLVRDRVTDKIGVTLVNSVNYETETNCK